MANAEDILVEVKGLVPTPTGCGVFLSNDHKVIAIFVDHTVAAAITMFMHGVKKPRPLTHDLIASIFLGLGVDVEKVVVNDLREDTFYARLYLSQTNELGRKVAEIDARPSDAIALSLQQQAPIYINHGVWEEADDMSWALEQASSAGGPGGEEDDEPPEETGFDNELPPPEA